MVVAATSNAFERMAVSGRGDAGALALGLRHGLTGVGLRSLAAKAVHVAAAAPDRMVDIYDNSAAGWLGGAIFPPRVRTPEPLPVSPAFWSAFWAVADPGRGAQTPAYGAQMMTLIGELDPKIMPRMAETALEFPGVAAIAGAAPPRPYDLEALSGLGPASVGFAFAQEARREGGLADPYWTSAVPYLRHMPAPLAYINIEVIHSMPLWGLVAGYSSRTLDRVALGGFLMAQVGHHYSAIASAVTLTNIALHRPANAEVILDCLFRGWAHGRDTRPLISVEWEPLWSAPIDQVRAALGITPFASPYANPKTARPTALPGVLRRE